jgi:hypothetical protein
MGIVDYFRRQYERARSKHQVHVRKAKSLRGGRVAHATVNPAGTKLAKYFKKAALRGPRGY